MNTKTNNLWDMLESPPPHATKTADLFRWALNCDHRKPWTLFLDLIGFSAETYDRDINQSGDLSDGLGYAELDYMAEALREYATSPNMVKEWIRELLGAGS